MFLYKPLDTANLEGADLYKANLKGADLGNAILKRARLDAANLQGAYLGNASLQGAYLGNASLQGADLRGANLEGADLRDASLDNVVWDAGAFGVTFTATLPDGKKWTSDTDMARFTDRGDSDYDETLAKINTIRTEKGFKPID